MGLGKTIQCISLLSFLAIQRGVSGPFLVVAPLSTIPSWQRECAKWSSFLDTVVYTGSARSREIIREYEWYTTEKTRVGGRGYHKSAAAKATIKFNVLITTYEFIIKDRHFLNKVPWQYLMVDEGQLRDWNSAACRLTMLCLSCLHLVSHSCACCFFSCSPLCLSLSSSSEGLQLHPVSSTERILDAEPTAHHRKYDERWTHTSVRLIFLLCCIACSSFFL